MSPHDPIMMRELALAMLEASGPLESAEIGLVRWRTASWGEPPAVVHAAGLAWACRRVLATAEGPGLPGQLAAAIEELAELLALSASLWRQWGTCVAALFHDAGSLMEETQAFPPPEDPAGRVLRMGTLAAAARGLPCVSTWGARNTWRPAEGISPMKGADDEME